MPIYRLGYLGRVRQPGARASVDDKDLQVPFRLADKLDKSKLKFKRVMSPAKAVA